MNKFWRWFIGASEDFNFDREFKKLIAATPAAELRKPTRASEEAKWPTRSSPSQRLTALRGVVIADPYAPKVRKQKAPKRVANARPSAKSKTHKSRL